MADLLRCTEDAKAYYNSFEQLATGIDKIHEYVGKKLAEGYAFVIADVNEEQGEIENLEYFQKGEIKKKGSSAAKTETVGYYFQLVPSYTYKGLDGDENRVDTFSDESNITDVDFLVDEISYAYENLDDDDFLYPDYRREIFVSKIPVDPSDENYFGPDEMIFVKGWMESMGYFE